MSFRKSFLLSEDSEEARRVRIARERIHAGEDPDPSHVRPLILESWRRSRRAGVDPQWGLKGQTPHPRDPGDAPGTGHAEPSKDQRLLDAAAPILQLLSDALSEHRFAMMLTDRHHRTVWLAGVDVHLREAEWVNDIAGGRWREEIVGTDAVALSYVIGEPVQVHWFEHYTAGLDPWTGNSAPIRDPDTRAIIGTINVYAYGCISHPLAFELAKDAAHMIERQLALGAEQRRVRLLEAYESHVWRHPDDRVICLTAQGTIVGVSASARAPLRITHQDLRGRPLSSVAGIELDGAAADLASVTTPRELQVRLGESRYAAEIRPVHQDAEVAGFLLRLRASTNGRPASRRAESAWKSAYRFDDIIGQSEAIRSAIASARRVAGRDDTVLIVGETGTGKELLAHAIHAESSRASGPFVPLNCGAVGGDLLAAELFGYEDGAFTGAARGGRAGKLELADRGTLFLDELEAMSPAMQVSLLRFLEEGSVVRVGAERRRGVDVRIVAATNVDLRALVRSGGFRADLYYRLDVCSIMVPPLRDRIDDIRLLAEHLIRTERLDKAIEASALAALERYPWPGNVRELRNVLVQASIRGEGPCITAADLVFAEEAPAPRGAPADLLGDAELRTILDVLDRHAGSIGAAASELGIHRVTLYRKLKRRGLNWTRGYR